MIDLVTCWLRSPRQRAPWPKWSPVCTAALRPLRLRVYYPLVFEQTALKRLYSFADCIVLFSSGLSSQRPSARLLIVINSSI